MNYPRLVENLINQLIKLPGIGRRSAERIVFWFLDTPTQDAKDIAAAILQLKDGLQFCKSCNNLSEREICQICSDPGRDAKTVCVVENPKDLIAIEKTGAFKGQYYVLLGAIAPSEGRGPEHLKIEGLFAKIRNNGVKEVVIATDPDTEGEMTSLHLTKELKPFGVKVSRIGLGIPVGSSVEYADLSTLSMSLSSRREILD